MKQQQVIRIVKKYCDDNPAMTHDIFTDIVYDAIGRLPQLKIEECPD